MVIKLYPNRKPPLPEAEHALRCAALQFAGAAVREDRADAWKIAQRVLRTLNAQAGNGRKAKEAH